MDKFFEGQKVEAIYCADKAYWIIGLDGVQKITVVMQNGQMAEVAWFAVWRDDKIETLYNSANIKSVTIESSIVSSNK